MKNYYFHQSLHIWIILLLTFEFSTQDSSPISKCLYTNDGFLCSSLDLNKLPDFKKISSIKSISLKSPINFDPSNSFFHHSAFLGLEVLNITLVADVGTLDLNIFFQLFKELRILKLTRVGIAAVSDLTKTYQHLECLIINTAGLQTLPPNLLHRLPNLRYLELNNNEISELGVHLFPPQTQLEYLSLSNNQLTYLDDSLSGPLAKLRTLRLNKNRFTALATSSIKNRLNITRLTLPILPGLETLELSKNSISRLFSLVFKNFRGLRVVRLRRNQIRHVDAGCFYVENSLSDIDANTPGLRVIDLAGNSKIGEIRPNWMYGLTHVTHLYLSKSGIKCILKNALDTMSFLTHLDLSSNQISSLNPNIFTRQSNSLKVLLLNDNRLTNVHPLIFSQLHKLEVLTLSHNSIHSFPAESSLNHSCYINNDSSSNQHLLDRMPRSIDDYLRSESAEETIPTADGNNKNNFETSVGMFSELRNLRSLDLSFNALQRLSLRDFTGPLTKSLVVLNLTGNPLTRIEPGTLTGLTKLVELKMNSTHLMCDCRLAKFVLWVKEKQFNLSALCDTPIFLKGRPIASLEYNQLHISTRACLPPHSLKPHLTLTTKAFLYSTTPASHPRDDVIQPPSFLNAPSNSWPKDPAGFTTPLNWALNGANLTLKCDVEIPDPGGYDTANNWELDGNLRPSVRWEKRDVGDNREWRVVQAAGDDDRPRSRSSFGLQGSRVRQDFLPLVRTEDDQLAVTRFRWTTFLIISHVQSMDNGRYRCSAENTYGIGKSSAIDFRVFTKPQLTEGPMPVIVTREDMTVAIPCTAQGYPPPTPSLLKAGRAVFSAAKGRRIMVDAQYSYFYITKVKAVDAGDYVCQNENVAGRVITQFTLVVNFSAILLTRPTSREQANLGGILVLKVVPGGVPRPSVVWSKDGRILRPGWGVDQRLQYGGPDKGVLIVGDVNASDVGVYTVNVTNELGSDSADITVDVHDRNSGHIFYGSAPLDSELSTPGPKEASPWVFYYWIGVVIIVVVLCVVLTSLLWVLALFCLYRRRRHYNTARSLPSRVGSLDKHAALNAYSCYPPLTMTSSSTRHHGTKFTKSRDIEDLNATSLIISYGLSKKDGGVKSPSDAGSNRFCYYSSSSINTTGINSRSRGLLTPNNALMTSSQNHSQLMTSSQNHSQLMTQSFSYSPLSVNRNMYLPVRGQSNDNISDPVCNPETLALTDVDGTPGRPSSHSQRLISRCGSSNSGQPGVLGTSNQTGPGMTSDYNSGTSGDSMEVDVPIVSAAWPVRQEEHHYYEPPSVCFGGSYVPSHTRTASSPYNNQRSYGYQPVMRDSVDRES